MTEPEAAPRKSPVPAGKNVPPGCGATILFVEDENAVRRLVARLLESHGFRVMAAENGRTAMPLWEEHQSSIDLLLTDVVMPEGISGRELAETFLRAKPDLKVIYTSGFNLELSGRDGRLRDGINFVQKPYRPEHLLSAVRSALAAPGVKPF